MRYMRYMRRSFLLFVILFFTIFCTSLFLSCPTTFIDPDDDIDDPTDQATYTVIEQDIPAGAEVYFVFSNVSPDPAPLPVIASVDDGGAGFSISRSLAGATGFPTSTGGSRGAALDTAYAEKGVLYGYRTGEGLYAAIREENRRLAAELIASGGGSSAPATSRAARMSTTGSEEPGMEVGSSTIKFNAYYDGEVPMTLRHLTSAIETIHGERQLRIWVEDERWHESDNELELKVTLEMVKMVRDVFLNHPDENIYHWVSAIFGPEWGEHERTDLIQPNGIIDIVLYDINNTDPDEGGVAGYFWALHNYTQSRKSNSNEMVAFAINAVLLAAPDPLDKWDSDHYWPRQIKSTLAHELQHMINFYQSVVLYGVSMEIWLDELLSMSTEDIISDKLMVEGPRGVGPELENETYVYEAGPVNNSGGRLPLFNVYNDDNLIEWRDSDNIEVYRDYAMSYAFGAYLTRNYKGAEILRAVAREFKTQTWQNGQNGYGSDPSINAVVAGVRAVTGDDSITFKDLMQNWGKAVLFSDRDDDSVPPYSRYNKGDNKEGAFIAELTLEVDGGQSSQERSQEYKLGSINLYNYNYKYNGMSDSGPFIFGPGEVSDKLVLSPMSNTYYLADEEVPGGTMTWEIGLPPDVYVTVVVKELVKE